MNKENMSANTDCDEEMSLKKTHYHVADTLGEGSFGAVCTVYDDEGGTFAMKAFDKETEEIEADSDCSDEEFEDEDYEWECMDLGTLREISVLRLFAKLSDSDDKVVEHPGIMRLHDICKIRGQMCMVMPKLACPLNSAITGGALKGKKKLEVAHKLLSTMAFLHKNHIIHRDIKCENILMDDDMNPVLADFSLAKFIAEETTGSTHTPGVGTACYKAPEVYYEKPYGLAADCFSMGVVLVELFNGMLSCDRDKAALKQMEDIRAKLSDKPMPALLKGLLAPDPAERLTAEQALQSPVFAKLKVDPAIAQVVTKALPQPTEESQAKSKRGKKKKSKGKKAKKNKKRKQMQRGEQQLVTLLEITNPLTMQAAKKYHEASGEAFEHCAVVAAKMYEEELLGMSFVEDTLEDFDADVYAEAELNIFKAMDWCLFIE